VFRIISGPLTDPELAEAQGRADTDLAVDQRLERLLASAAGERDREHHRCRSDCDSRQEE
jgi:hypothetical protein